MTWPVGAMLMFFGAYPAGWGALPEQPAYTLTPGYLCALDQCPYSMRPHPEMPDGAQWCVKQAEPKP